MILSSPLFWMMGSATPYWSTRLRSTARRRSMLSGPTGFSGVSFA